MKKLTKGQSLIEILIALSVMVLVLVALLSLTVTSLSSTSSAKIASEATKYTQTMMEQIRNYYLSNQWADFDSGCSSSPPFDQKIVFDSSTYFTDPVVTCTNDVNNNKKIVITVTWTDQKGVHQSQIEDFFIPR